MIELTENEHDAVSEAFNIGMGSAGNALSEMIDKEVLLSVPNVSIERRSAAAGRMMTSEDHGDHVPISGVRERFSGPFQGSALLLFPEARSLELVRLLLQQPDADLDFLTEMEQEALTEVGNIILNACLSAIAEIMGEEIINEIPEPVKGMVADIISAEYGDSTDDFVMQLQMKFQVEAVNIEGQIAFLMDLQSIDRFRAQLATFFGFEAAHHG